MIEVLPVVVPIYRGEYRRKTEPKHLPVNRVRKDSRHAVTEAITAVRRVPEGMDNIGRRLARVKNSRRTTWTPC